jgi:hypothetical protein
MALTFTVHEPPQPAGDRLDRAESLLFVKDGFTWSAAFFAPIWLIVHRLWWPLLAYVAIVGLFEAIRFLGIIDPGWITLANIGLHVLIGCEGDTLRRWSLERSGWRMLGSVSGKTAAECERRFFDRWLPGQPVVAATPTRHPLPDGPRRSTPIIGSLLGVRS